jgi:Holliday junction resolvase
MDGSREERRLVRYLNGCGFYPMRAPASGSATENDLPDVIASRKNGAEMWAGELKTAKDGRGYFGPDEVDALQRFADAYGARALLILRPGGDRVFHCLPVEDAEQTNSGNYRLHEPDTYAEFDGITLQRPDKGGIRE